MESTNHQAYSQAGTGERKDGDSATAPPTLRVPFTSLFAFIASLFVAAGILKRKFEI
ncbi:MAG: hypothetical protein IH840_02055 [Candidatus Heimdallarchaeota archaeon]|nr:hypothetical protein [Candidatus Heimdallarchaeota archaeon]